jgi:uncharacterized repeat protein (TIGR03803 family)
MADVCMNIGSPDRNLREASGTRRGLNRGAVLAMLGALITCALLFYPRQPVSVTLLHSFTGKDAGRTPSVSLAQGKGGTLFGATWEGGPEGAGMLFGISMEGELRMLYPRNGTSLVEADDGHLYCVATTSRTNADQVILRLQRDGEVSLLHAFPGGDARVWPAGGLVQATDGYLYGMTLNGGEHGHGTLYKISVDGAFTDLHELEFETDGRSPFGRLIQHSNGNLYGVATHGGAMNRGTAFGVNLSGEFTVLHAFEEGRPDGSLVEAEDGNLYGLMTDDVNRAATIFRLSTDGAFTRVHSLPWQMSVGPSLALGDDGLLYGVDKSGGRRRTGSLWRISTCGNFSVVHDFTGRRGGEARYGELVRGIDGNLYGTTAAGGLHGCGTIFQLTIRR